MQNLKNPKMSLGKKASLNRNLKTSQPVIPELLL